MKSKVIAVRVEAETTEKLEKLEINLSSLLRELLEQHLKTKRCPTCGQHVKKSSK